MLNNNRFSRKNVNMKRERKMLANQGPSQKLQTHSQEIYR